MSCFRVRTAQRDYDVMVERGAVRKLSESIPKSAGKVFVVTTAEVWSYHGEAMSQVLEGWEHRVLFFPGSEERKRLFEVEALAEHMALSGADRTSLVIGFGGGIVTDVAGFLAAIFMRGVPVIQVPTTLLAQVDAGVGGKTGVNLVSGKNLIGSFHQPLAVLIDPELVGTLPEREYRAGLYEVIKCGVIRDPELFELMADQADAVMSQAGEVVDWMIAAAVKIKADVVSADERESDLRRILNFGHTVGHALEAETDYSRLLHGEAIAFGMRAATHLARMRRDIGEQDASRILSTVERYGPIPPIDDIYPHHLLERLRADKKTIHGKVHFVLPVRIGEVKIVSGVDDKLVLAAIEAALA